MKWNDQQVQENVFAVDGLQEALLGRPATRSLGVLQELINVSGKTSRTEDVSELFANYPQLTSGLGQMKAECKVVLRPDANVFALTYPGWVPLAMLPPVKNKLFKMLTARVIERVTEADGRHKKKKQMANCSFAYTTPSSTSTSSESK